MVKLTSKVKAHMSPTAEQDEWMQERVPTGVFDSPSGTSLSAPHMPETLHLLSRLSLGVTEPNGFCCMQS